MLVAPKIAMLLAATRGLGTEPRHLQHNQQLERLLQGRVSTGVLCTAARPIALSCASWDAGECVCDLQHRAERPAWCVDF